MALGTNDISSVKGYQAEALKVCKDELSDQLYSFKWVNDRLRLWADETVIGEELRTDMTKLVEGIDALINLTRILCDKIGDFADNQSRINNGGSGDVHTV